MSIVEQKKSRRERRSEARAASDSNVKNKKEDQLEINHEILADPLMLDNALIFNRNEVKEILKKQFQEFLTRENKDTKIVINLNYRGLCKLFSPQELDELELKRRKKNNKEESYILFRPSNRNRRKTSRYSDDDNNEQFGSTWSSEDVTKLILGLMDDEPVPTISLNVYYLKEFGLVTVWDGDSKTRAIKAFIDDREVIEVFPFSRSKKVSKTTPYIYSLITKEEKKDNPRILAALEEFVYQRNEQTISTNYMKRSWLEENEFGDLVEKIEEAIPEYRINNMSPEKESSVYQKEGEGGAPQTLIQLMLAKLSDSIISIAYKDDNGKDIHTIHGRLTIVSNSFSAGDLDKKGTPIHNLLAKRFHWRADADEKQYAQVDEFLFHLLAISGMSLNPNTGEMSFDTSEFYNDSIVLRAYVRNLDDKQGHAVGIVDKFYKDYIAAKEKFTVADPRLLKKIEDTIRDRYRTVEVLLGYCPSTTLEENGGCGIESVQVIELINNMIKGQHVGDGNKFKRNLRDAAQELPGIDDNANFGNLKQLNKFDIAEFSLLLFSFALNYTFENRDKLKHPANVTEVYLEILQRFLATEDGWVDYVFARGSFKKNTIKENDFYDTFGWTKKDKEASKSTNAGRAAILNDRMRFPMSFGEFMIKVGGNLEKVALLANSFYENEIAPALDGKYNGASNNRNIRKAFYKSMEERGVDNVRERSVIIYGEPVPIKDIEIGHIKADSVGGLLFLVNDLPLFQPETPESNKIDRTDLRNPVTWLNDQIESYGQWQEDLDDIEDDLKRQLKRGEITRKERHDKLNELHAQDNATEIFLELVEEMIITYEDKLNEMGISVTDINNN